MEFPNTSQGERILGGPNATNIYYILWVWKALNEMNHDNF